MAGDGILEAGSSCLWMQAAARRAKLYMTYLEREILRSSAQGVLTQIRNSSVERTSCG